MRQVNLPGAAEMSLSEIPDQAELEREQLHLTNEKLRLEASKLQKDAQPEKWWSRLVALHSDYDSLEVAG